MENEKMNNNLNNNINNGQVAGGQISAKEIVAKDVDSDKKDNEKRNIAIGATSGVLILMVIVISAVLTVMNSSNNNNGGAGTSGSTSQQTEVTEEEVIESAGTNITEAGKYTLSGAQESVVINTTGDVELTLDSVNITSSGAPAIYVANANSVNLILKGESTFNVTNLTDDLDAAILAASDLTLSGDGKITISSSDTAVKSKKNLTVKGGTYVLNTSNDGFHAKGKLQIDGGTMTIDGAEGLEATYVLINGGTINITASDDGINAADKSDDYEIALEINGGDITINMAAGDTDALDSNGNLTITGGTINITAQSAFDYDGTATYTGGTLIVNGETVDSITSQMMGGPGGQQGDPNAGRAAAQGATAGRMR